MPYRFLFIFASVLTLVVSSKVYSHDYSVNIFLKLGSCTVIYIICVRAEPDIYNSRLRFQFVYPIKITAANVVNGT